MRPLGTALQLGIPVLAGGASIGSLLLYFMGTLPMATGVVYLLVPGVALVAAQLVWLRRAGRRELADRILGGIWAGGLATLAYDIARVPISLAGVPVFKAISYFGTVILHVPLPTVASEIVGWAYHLSNGVAFALIYTALVSVPRWWTAVLWGVTIEGAMLLTPYAEVFGYQRSMSFSALTLGSHVIYGLGLWAGLRVWTAWRELGEDEAPFTSARGLRIAGWLAPLVVIGATGASFHQQHAQGIAPSPPADLGGDLYTTWNVPEPDRVIALWIFQKHVNPGARFHFVPPFTKILYGTPFDVPEATIRRTADRAVSQVLIAQEGLSGDLALERLGRIAYYYEIAPWQIPADSDARTIGRELALRASKCSHPRLAECLADVFAFLDQWYAAERGVPG